MKNMHVPFKNMSQKHQIVTKIVIILIELHVKYTIDLNKIGFERMNNT